jgi:UDP-N-acetylglucosamine diphosphorylase / glucose-1-phosphate thymidylyltransferase / UDP-N-acetylgalactosamine diphosphorylase / glucosamine-1-phosphate N-acetyltransferase / galactosamine-1-phosphate N-acetyltransferase
VKAVILAAGEGVRLQPITSTRPKHLIKVGGKPILKHCLNAIKTARITETVVVVHYMPDSIRRCIGDGGDSGMKIEYVEQKAVAGTGDAVSTAEPYVKEDFLLVYGDLLFSSAAVKRVVELHSKKKPAVTMAVVPVDEPEDYGIVEIDEEGRVKSLTEKPSREKAKSNLANAGIYVFSTDIFGKAKEISPSSRGEWEVTDAISKLIDEKRTVLSTTLPSGEWVDIGRPWDLLEANRWALERMSHSVEGNIENGAILVGPVTVAESARVRSGAYIEGPAFIDDESDIGPNCYVRPHTSIGRKVRMGNACEVKNSIIMDDTHVGHLAYVGDSILCEKCNLGAGTVTANYRFDAGNVKMMVKDKLVDSQRTKLGAVLGDGVKSGINALFMPGVKVGVNSWVGANVVVERDLPAETVVLLKQTLEKKVLQR